MKKIISSVLSVMLAVLYALTNAQLSAFAVSSQISTDNSPPSTSLYYGSITDSNKMIAPYLEWGGNTSYCIGTSSETTPFAGVSMSDATLITDAKLIRIMLAGYPYTSSSYGLDDRDYHYVTQMAIRCYVGGRSASMVNSADSDMLAEFNRIFNARNGSGNPTTSKAKITGSANKTTVTIGGTDYYRFGPYSASVENGTLISSYAISLSNSSTFHHFSANPASANNYAFEYSKNDSFYVFAPVGGSGSTTVSLKIPSGNSTAPIKTFAYHPLNSSYQSVAVLYLDEPNDDLPASFNLSWDETGTPGEPPEEPEEPEPTPPGNLKVRKRTMGNVNIEGIEIWLSGYSDDGDFIWEWDSTDSTGAVYFSDIPAGTYDIDENSMTVNTDWYHTASRTVTISGGDHTISLVNPEKCGSIKIQKTSTEMLNLEGIKFILTGMADNGREVRETATTDENGVAYFNNNIPIGTYTIIEDETSIHYAYLTCDPLEDVRVEYLDELEYEVYNPEKMGEVKVYKKTTGMKNVESILFWLEGTSESGRHIWMGEYTDEEGIAHFKDVPIGTYSITEEMGTVNTDLYMSQEEWVVHEFLNVDASETAIVEFEKVSTIIYVNFEKLGEVLVYKETTGMINLQGIRFWLYGTSYTGREISQFSTTDEKGRARFEDLPLGTYMIVEDPDTVHPAYELSTQRRIEVFWDITSDTKILNPEKLGKLKIQKKTEGMVNIEGVRFVIEGTTDSGRPYKNAATTNAAGVATITDIPIGTYMLIEDETKVPVGYLRATDTEIRIDYNEETVVEVYNPEKSGKVKIQKTTESMDVKSISGITMILEGIADNGREVYQTAVTGADGVAIFENVPLGSYYVVMEDSSTVPYGYMTAAPIGDVVVSYRQETPLTIFNFPDTDVPLTIDESDNTHVVVILMLATLAVITTATVGIIIRRKKQK